MKWIIITKKHLICAGAVALLLTVGIVLSSVAFASSGRLIPIYCVENDKKQIAISFDAAWGNDDTETLINTLAEYDVPATFFVVGAWVDKYPESVKQLADAGHKICNHSDSHPNMPDLSYDKQVQELKNCNQKIESVSGQTPELFRCPYGAYSNDTIKAAESLGMYTVQWDVDSLDWKDSATAKTICDRVTSKVQSGSIILFHNDADHTPEALPTILKCLKEEGYEFVLIEDLILKENYKIDHAGKQCKLKDGE